MKKFIVKLTIICFSLYVIAYLLHFVIDRGLKSSNAYANYYYEWNDIYNSKINSDVLIQGSSRAWIHFNPAIIDTALKVNSYNLGLDGYNFHMQYCCYRIYNKHNKKPDLIIQSLDLLSLYKRPDLYRYEQFIPNLDDPLIKQATSQYEGFTLADYYIPLYKYTHRPNMALNALQSLNNEVPSNQKKYKGFASFDKKWNSSFADFKKQNPDGYRIKVDPATIKLFDEFLSECKENKIKVVLVYTPEYIGLQNFTIHRDSLFNIYRSFAQKYNYAFLDYSNNFLCRDTSNFYNSQHLNKNGVQKFNEIFVEDLKKIISKNP